jgi:hypothetical protein
MPRQQTDDRGEVILYRAEDGRTALDVRLAGETVWLTLNQMADLFGRDKSVVSRHLRNIFVSKELSRKSVVAKNATTAADGKTYQVEYYNLDAIISVGYRVNSKRGTQFRIWATQTLKDHLMRGYTLNERRLREKGLSEAEQAIQLLSRTLTRHQLVNAEGAGVLDIVSRYAKSWLLLKEYDEEQLSVPAQRQPARASLDSARTREAIGTLKTRLLERQEATRLFGQERSEALMASSAPSNRPSTAKRSTRASRKGRAPALLRHQGPPLRRRQQTHRLVPVHPVPAREQLSRRRERRDQDQRQRTGGTRVADRRERTAQ